MNHTLTYIVENKQIASTIFDMTIDAPEIAKEAKAGQFVSLYPDNGENILARPISICEIHKDSGRLRLVYQVVGKGTKLMSEKVYGQQIRVLGPLGNGFEPGRFKRAVLIGGGIGAPPLLELAKQLTGETRVFLGFRSEQILLKDFTKNASSVNIATDDGSFGFKGNVVELIKKLSVDCDIVYSCGPGVMLRAVADYCMERGILCRLSMEERMACGIGACVGCVVKVRQGEGFVYKKVCKDGPVFDASEVIFDNDGEG